MNRKQSYIRLFEHYLDQYDELLRATESGELHEEYARGGEYMHRGFYCPSPVFDIVAGGVNRGKLLMTKKAAKTADYCFLFRKNKLVRADAYASFEEKGRVLYTREFILRDEDMEIAPLYNVWPEGHVRLAGMTICEYLPDNKRLPCSGKILRYVRIHAISFALDTFRPTDFDIYVETYSYDHEGLLVSSTLENIACGSAQLRSYVFRHDEEGKIVSYHVLNGTACEREKIYPVPRSKQRKI